MSKLFSNPVFLTLWTIFWASAAAYCIIQWKQEAKKWAEWREAHPRSRYRQPIAPPPPNNLKSIWDEDLEPRNFHEQEQTICLN